MSEPKQLDIVVGSVREAGTNVTHISDPMVSMIERVVLDPNASIEKLERMLAMKERLEDRALEERARQQTLAYYKAKAECQAKLKVIVKNKSNNQTNSKYADLAALAEQADPIIHAHGFSVSFQPAGTSEKGDPKIKWTISHAEGHVESDTAEIPLDAAGAKGVVNKTATHAFGSTMSYGRRYLKLMLFDIATGDDTDGNTPGAPITAEQVDELIALADETEADKAKICAWQKVASFKDIPAKKYREVKSMLDDRKKARESSDV